MNCKWCGDPLEGKRAHAEYCDSSCRASYCLDRQERGLPPVAPKKALTSVAVVAGKAPDVLADERQEWIERIRYSILAAAFHHPRKEVDADAIRDLGVPDRFRSSITGPQFGALRRDGYLEQIDFRPAKTGARHGGTIRGYRLTDNGAEAFQQMPEPPEVEEALKLVPDSIGHEAPKSLITDGDAEWAA